MTTYNHAFTFAFSIAGCTDPEGEVAPAILRQAILTRLASIDDSELAECCGMPFDTYEEEALHDTSTEEAAA